MRKRKSSRSRRRKRSDSAESWSLETSAAALLQLRSKTDGARRLLIEADDATLGRALLEGDPRAAWVAWHRFAPLVRRMIRRLLDPGSDIEDLLQQVFVCFFERIPTLQEPQALKAFVIAITLNNVRSEVRRRRVRQTLWRSWASTPGPVHPDPEAREALSRFCRIMDGLGPADGTAFMLRFVDNRDLDDVASTLGVSLSTVKRRLNRIWHRVAAQVERDPALSSYLMRSFVKRSLPLDDDPVSKLR